MNSGTAHTFPPTPLHFIDDSIVQYQQMPRRKTMPQSEALQGAREWMYEVEQNLHAIEIIGKKLIADRQSCSNPGTELILISQEAKLIRHVARVYVLNTMNRGSRFMPLSDWFCYVNLQPAELNRILQHLHTLPDLAALNDKQILDLCDTLGFTTESRRRLRKSSYSLKRYILRWQADGIEPVRVFLDKDLAWMSFTRLAPGSVDRRSASESAVDSGASDSGSGVGSNVSQSSLPICTPPPSPGILLTASPSVSGSAPSSAHGRLTSHTPPAALRLNGTMESTLCEGASTSNISLPTGDTLTRSHSHESNLQHGLSTGALIAASPTKPGMTASRSINDCLSVVSRPTTLSPPSPISLHTRPSVIQFGGSPKSPKTGRAMHSIPHQWHRRKVFRIAAENCHFCQRQLSFFSEYEKCKSCKWKVHPHCKANIGDSCGLTPAHLKEVLKEMFLKDSGQDGWTPSIHASTSQHTFAFDSIDSSSSTNSSAPSTPAFPAIHSATISSSSSPFLVPASTTFRSNFDFPESVPEVPDIVVDTGHSDAQQRLISSQGSDCTVQSGCTGGPGSSDGTLVTDSFGSGQTNTNEIQDDNSNEQQPVANSCALNRDRWSNGTIRMPNSWNDVTIPFSQIEFKKQSLVGRGRFAEVHKANWYGDVAVKLLNMDHVDEERQLEAFKAEVASFKNTRHDNIVLFMGYCMDQHKLGIVMYYCKGRPLHQLLHDIPEKFDFSQVVHLATQTCQGMSYLHTKKIIHKDLRTKNIFIENRNRVVITDFGLFSMKRLAQPYRNHTLIVPDHWLSYLAPELIKELSAELTQLPFSEASDVYAFGTIWFELMTYGFPFEQVHPDVVVWQVGRGMKGALSNLRGVREIKVFQEIVVQCWAYTAGDRPSFRDLLDMLERLPKKRLNRSPSFPISRSYESMF
uniref:Protein kinase domain-containing protein n=3 Tax=Parascaris univalens TaxID=6257 RepID=A0A915B8E6_PARUN